MTFETLTPLPPGLSVVIPVYNSAITLADLCARLDVVLPQLQANFEVILINDGSRDDSWHTIRTLSSQYAWLRGFNLMRNYGQHNALLCGIRQARFDTIVTMDDDLQHPPEEIHKLLAALADGFDVVYGIPAELPHERWRNFASVWTKRILARLIGVRNVRDFAAFRAFRTRLRRAFAHYENPNVLIDALLSWGTTRFGTVVVHEAPRAAGESGYNLRKLIKYTLVVLTSFSTLPLRFTTLLGFLFTLFGVGVLIYVLTIALLYGSPSGFPFLASLVALFSGAQMMALGILGEYLARIFDRSMDHPPYVVDEQIN